jgi:hypothetical protein
LPTIRRRLPDWARVAAAAVLVLAPIVVLHLVIYGPAQSPYMRNSAGIGFTLYDLGWKTYVLLLDPYPWFLDGIGLARRIPWLALALAGLVPALFRGAKDRVLAATLLLHAVLYISYVDLLPTGLWRFLNVHYFVWALPGWALLAALLLRDLARPGRALARPGRARWIAAASLPATALLLCLRAVPVPAADDAPAKALDFAGPTPGFAASYFGDDLALHVELGDLHNFTGMRVLPTPHGVRVIALRRAFTGRVGWVPGHAPPGFEGTAPVARSVSGTRLAFPPHWWRRPPPSLIGPEQ